MSKNSVGTVGTNWIREAKFRATFGRSESLEMMSFFKDRKTLRQVKLCEAGLCDDNKFPVTVWPHQNTSTSFASHKPPHRHLAFRDVLCLSSLISDASCPRDSRFEIVIMNSKLTFNSRPRPWWRFVGSVWRWNALCWNRKNLSERWIGREDQAFSSMGNLLSHIKQFQFEYQFWDFNFQIEANTF